MRKFENWTASDNFRGYTATAPLKQQFRQFVQLPNC